MQRYRNNIKVIYLCKPDDLGKMVYKNLWNDFLKSIVPDLWNGKTAELITIIIEKLSMSVIREIWHIPVLNFILLYSLRSIKP